jgi:hypothetical protein
MSEPARPIYLDYNASTPIDPRVLDRLARLPAVARSVPPYTARAKSTWRGPEISATTRSDPLVRS